MVLQENEPVILYLVFVCVDLNVFEGSTKGQILHLVHMLMPGMCLAGLVAGSFAWTSVFFKLAGCLKATIGGFGNLFYLRLGSLLCFGVLTPPCSRRT